MQKKVSEINYWEIIKKAFQISWKNKFLWWFGFILIFAGQGFSFNNFTPNDQDSSEEIEKILQENLPTGFASWESFLQEQWAWILAGALFILAIILVFIILGKIARGGLIKSIELLSLNQPSTFRLGFSHGIKCFWKIFLIDFFIFIAMLLIMLILILPIFFIFKSGSYIAGIILGLPALIFLVFVIALFFFIRSYGYLYASLTNLTFWMSIENAYALFKKNFWTSIVMSLLFIPVGLLWGMLLIFSLLILAMVFIPLGFLFYALFQIAGAVVVGILAGILFLGLIFLLASFEIVFEQSAWFLFFKEIATKPKVEEVALEKVSAPAIEIKPTENPSVNMEKLDN